MKHRRLHGILAIQTLLVAWWTGRFISMDYWTSWPASILIGSITGVPIFLACITAIAYANISMKAGRALLLSVLSFLIGTSAAWGWIRLDDWTFGREAYFYESGYSRPRWFPYQAIALEQDEAGDPIVYE